jgi:hypothetical protein
MHTHTGTTSTTLRYEQQGDHLVVVGISECCKCEQPTEDLVLCPRCGSVKR